MKLILEDIELFNGNDNYTYDIFNEHNNKYGDIFVAIPYDSEGIVINSPVLYYRLTKPIEKFTIEDKEFAVNYCTGKYDANDFSIADAFIGGGIETINKEKTNEIK